MTVSSLRNLGYSADEAQVGRLRARQVERGGLAGQLGAAAPVALAGRHQVLVAPHAVEVIRLRLLPGQLGQLEQRLRCLGRVRAVSQEVFEQLDPLAPGRPDLALLARDDRFELGRQGLLRRLLAGRLVVVRLRLLRTGGQGQGRGPDEDGDERRAPRLPRRWSGPRPHR